jgi:hypothetical protein
MEIRLYDTVLQFASPRTVAAAPGFGQRRYYVVITTP